MLSKVAAALLAASVFTAPVLAQGTQTASPPAKTGTVGPAATAAAPKVVAAKPALKVAKAKHAKHAKHAKRHVAHKHARHLVRSKSTTDARGGAMNAATPRSVTN